VQCPIGLAVATAVESVALLATRGRIAGRDPADFREGSLESESTSVVAHLDEHARGDLGADAEQIKQPGIGQTQQSGNLGAKELDLGLEAPMWTTPP
jgi:hypothetical protein